jgi:cytochrome P450
VRVRRRVRQALPKPCLGYCVGANLARLELREALSFLARRVRRLELDGDPVFESITGIYGLAELPVRLSL